MQPSTNHVLASRSGTGLPDWDLQHRLTKIEQCLMGTSLLYFLLINRLDPRHLLLSVHLTHPYYPHLRLLSFHMSSSLLAMAS